MKSLDDACSLRDDACSLRVHELCLPTDRRNRIKAINNDVIGTIVKYPDSFKLSSAIFC